MSCEYCEGKWSIYEDDNSHAIISRSWREISIEVWDNVLGSDVGFEMRFSIEFCPICGERLVTE